MYHPSSKMPSIQKRGAMVPREYMPRKKEAKGLVCEEHTRRKGPTVGDKPKANTRVCEVLELGGQLQTRSGHPRPS